MCNLVGGGNLFLLLFLFVCLFFVIKISVTLVAERVSVVLVNRHCLQCLRVIQNDCLGSTFYVPIHRTTFPRILMSRWANKNADIGQALKSVVIDVLIINPSRQGAFFHLCFIRHTLEKNKADLTWCCLTLFRLTPCRGNGKQTSRFLVKGTLRANLTS